MYKDLQTEAAEIKSHSDKSSRKPLFDLYLMGDHISAQALYYSSEYLANNYYLCTMIL